ncbi:hypothetical protein OU789_10755 [Halocynthiibacter sp. C4]|uniref:hypothetical protein n=1 Tax=Halocynthiibacter sp. C4 TaxID=2992758 RepID=UPI00237B5787|nr:hypothetical protein [Halocynthiibacter sp. C4]MDE0590406.1 hypothetical protein [Halocynthiibacter sp. C4]
MRKLSLVLMMLASGCANGSLEAFCHASRDTVDIHADALANSPDDRSVISGANLIAQWDAACP